MARPLKYPLNYVPGGSYLTFIRRTRKDGNKNGVRISEAALYQCKCGKRCVGLTNNVKLGRKLSCGCRNDEMRLKSGYKHGLSNHPLYRVWENMLSRCYNKKVCSYKNYGGRGVTMCDEWKKNPAEFIRWGLSNGWMKGLEIDKDIKGNGLLYSPETCVFVSPQINSLYKRTNLFIEYNGVVKTASQWADEYGILRNTLYERLKRMKISEALA